MTELTPEQYRDLLQAALPAAGDADTIDIDLRTLFTPDRHRLALDPDVTVVRGGRGAGKTVWFRALQDDRLRELVANEYQFPRLHEARPLAGYGTMRRPDLYPGPAALEGLLAGQAAPADIWTAVLLRALDHPAVAERQHWPERIAWVRAHPDDLDIAIAKADREAEAKRSLRLFLVDALDRLHRERRHADELVSGLLRLALDLRTTTRYLRAKVFIRHDMLESADLRFPDSSKLIANAADLTWSEPNLYGLLFHQLGNAAHPLAANFRGSVSSSWRAVDAVRHVPPPNVVGDADVQREIFTRIAGAYMGAGHRKGHTYTWLPNHLMDGRAQVSPRSFLRALTVATDVTRTTFAGHNRALHSEGIRQGVQEASKTRVAEVKEDLPWVAIAIAPLSGLQVPVEQGLIEERWTAEGLSGQLHATDAEDIDDSMVTTGPRYPDDYAGLISELIDLGVMSRRADNRLDLPDVYRIAFGIGRRGGVPRVRS